MFLRRRVSHGTWVRQHIHTHALLPSLSPGSLPHPSAPLLSRRPSRGSSHPCVEDILSSSTHPCVVTHSLCCCAPDAVYRMVPSEPPSRSLSHPHHCRRHERHATRLASVSKGSSPAQLTHPSSVAETPAVRPTQSIAWCPVSLFHTHSLSPSPILTTSVLTTITLLVFSYSLSLSLSYIQPDTHNKFRSIHSMVDPRRTRRTCRSRTARRRRRTRRHWARSVRRRWHEGRRR